MSAGYGLADSRYNIPVTWNICTQTYRDKADLDTRALEKSPYWIKPMLDSGAELSLGGHLYKNQFDTPPEEEDRLINTSIDKLQELTGDKTLPKGELHARFG